MIDDARNHEREGISIFQNELPYVWRSIFGRCKTFLRTGVWHFKTLPLSKVI
jgi:hypothetical protein